MKFFCEYCGNRIDANIDRKCPNCGASYKKNKKFLELEAERKRQADLTNEYAHKILGHVTGSMKFSKIFDGQKKLPRSKSTSEAIFTQPQRVEIYYQLKSLTTATSFVEAFHVA